ncbi:MAG: alpha/beta hydrolase [Acidimicrobiia bacterium]
MTETADVAGPGNRTGSARLVRHIVRLPDGHRVGISVAGQGLPFVMVNGFGANGSIYQRSLGRLAHLGFCVIAIDAPGHGDTDSLGIADLFASADLVSRTLEVLGVRRAVLAGHSMGGRIVTELAANRPDQAVAVVLLNGIVGEPWDRVQRGLLFPPLLAKFLFDFVVDLVDAVPRQSKGVFTLGADARRTLAHHLSRPWDVLGAAATILRTGPSRELLDRLQVHGTPLIAVHGDRDRVVPLSAAADAARRTHGELVVIREASHSWMLRCAETLPGIVESLLQRSLGSAMAAREVEDCYAPEARVRRLAVTGARPAVSRRAIRPRYRWSYERTDVPEL